MSSYQQASTDIPDVQQHFLANQANLFLFDLKNEATEHGFKTGESWVLQLATEDEMVGLKRQHHLLVSVRLQPHNLQKVFQQVKNGLQQSLNTDDLAFMASDPAANEKSYLAAYRSDNIRK